MSNHTSHNKSAAKYVTEATTKDEAFSRVQWYFEMMNASPDNETAANAAFASKAAFDAKWNK